MHGKDVTHLCEEKHSQVRCNHRSLRTGFSHCTEMVPVKSYDDSSRPSDPVEKRVV